VRWFRKHHAWYLVFDKSDPEPSDGAFVGVGGEKRRSGVREGRLDIIHDDHGLTESLAPVEENGDLLVDGVALEEELALVHEVLLHVLVAQALEVERELHPGPERAEPCAQKLQLVAST